MKSNTSLLRTLPMAMLAAMIHDAAVHDDVEARMNTKTNAKRPPSEPPFMEGLFGKGASNRDYSEPHWQKNRVIDNATPEEKAERQRQNNKRTKLTKRERKALKR